MFLQEHNIRHRFSNHFSLVVVALVLNLALTMRAAPWQTIERHLPTAAASLTPVGQLADTNRLHLAIALPLRNPDVLSNLLQQLYDPASPNYHHYLTPDQFTEQFGPTAADYEAVIAFAKANGLPVEAMHPNRVLLDVSGTVAEVQRALHITMRTYRHPTEDRTFFAPDTAPTLQLATRILGISGLNNYSLPRPYFTAKPLISGSKAVANAGSGLSGTYLGNDFRAAYLPGTTLDGSGQVVGLLEMDGYTAGDIAYYESRAGLPNITLSNVLLDGFNGSPTGNGGEGEVSLDIEMAICMAPNLSQVIIYEAGPSGNWHDLLNRMATDNLASQISSSWGSASVGPDAVADQIWQQMAAQGQSFFQASGDKSAYTGVIPFPNDSPYITQVGGTTLTTSGPGGYWVAEQVWNQYTAGTGSGGGISTSYSIPSWQAKLNMTSNLGSKTKRNTPDVAMIADQVYVRADGVDYNFQGTSCAAPLWAGLTALANQQAAANGQPAIGFINPAVYAIGTNANYTQSFHDITVGNNKWYGSTTKFPAVSGYDLCTGWGTPKGPSLINALANYGNFLITPTTGFMSAGKAGGPFTVTAQTFTLTNNGGGSLNWTLANTSLWLKVSPTSGTLTSAGPATTVTVSLNTAASNLVVGTYSATVWFTNLNNTVGQSRQFTLSVITPPVITMQPTSQAVAEGRTAMFMVLATGGLPLVYQWQDNGTNLADGGNIVGRATTNLFISNVSPANAGNYSVVVSNGAGVVTSSNVLLTVLPSLPASGQVSFVLSSTLNVGNLPASVVAADVNGDGKPDLICVNGGDNTLMVLTNNGSGRFVQSTINYLSNYPYSVVAADVNGDGSMDMITANFSGNSLFVLTNNGSGIFALAGTYAVGNNPFSVVSADVNGDGKPDLICANSGSASISVLTNNGFGGFAMAGTYGVGNSPRSIVAADINGDGKIDIITPNNSDSTISVLTNNGSGSFLLAGTFAVGANPASVTAADVNGDGKMDLITANGNGSITVLTNSGRGNFVLSGTYAVGNNPYAVVAADVNGDGKVDLITANQSDNSLSVLTNNGSGGFMTAGTYQVGTNPGWVTAADVNGDGEVDLISANYHSDTLSVYTNATPFASPSIPLIITQPTNRTIVAGNTATFSVVVSSQSPMSYQWMFNNIFLASATNAALTLPGVTTTQAGTYAVVIANQAGYVTSSNAVLSVYSSAASFINGAVITTGNHLQFTVAGVPGFNYAVQASTNLIDWTWLITNTSPFSFTDTNNSVQQQFYRTVYQP